MVSPSVEAIRRPGGQKADGLATVLAIGTATPPNAVYQSTYPDYYFRVTNMEHEVELKQKFKNLCEKTMIKKRHLLLTEDMLKKNPELCADTAPSLDVRQEIAADAVPKLAGEAACRAIEEWGQPKSKITHLVFCSTSGVDIPGADYRLTKLLGLRPSVKRVMIYNQACYAGGTALRLAKDLAENGKGARVLVVCSEISVVNFRGPGDGEFGNLVGQAIFGDGAGALVVGADPDVAGAGERPLFEIVSASQTIVPNSDGAIGGHLRAAGMTFQLVRGVPDLLAENIEASLVEAFEPLGISGDWNSLFWVVHAGGRKILDRVEERLGLGPDKLRASRHVLSEYGNMSSACVLFTLDEMRRRSAAEEVGTTGEGLEWGVLLGFGPGLTVETVVLRSVAT